jgi:G3E family GTPase
LVQHILTARHGRRIAVILNEIGEEGGIEGPFVQDAAGGRASAAADWLELSNGCLCCSVKDDFVQALEALMARGGARLDHILIETTGVRCCCCAARCARCCAGFVFLAGEGKLGGGRGET